MESYLKC